MVNKKKVLLSVSCITAFMIAPFTAQAENGITADKIVFGQTAAIEGPASALGTGMRDGLQAAFKEINDAGGVNGRMLELVTLDDGYEPDKAITNTKALIETQKVFSIIGGVGTPTASAIEPITTEAKVPFVGPFTGAGFLRAPDKRYIVNVRGSYAAEAEAWIEYLTTAKGAKRIAILYQDDSFGRAGLSGVEAAMQKRNMELVARGTYARNTENVKSGLLDIKKGEPDAIVMVGAYKPIAAFIKLAKKLGLDVPMLNISFVGSKALAAELGADGEGVIITQVVPFPFDTSLPVVADYQKALKAAKPDAEPGFVSLEGYLVGRLAAAALAKVSGDVTRESFLDAIYNTGTFDLDGVKLVYGPNDNQGMDDVFFTQISADGSFVEIK